MSERPLTTLSADVREAILNVANEPVTIEEQGRLRQVSRFEARLLALASGVRRGGLGARRFVTLVLHTAEIDARMRQHERVVAAGEALIENVYAAAHHGGMEEWRSAVQALTRHRLEHMPTGKILEALLRRQSGEAAEYMSTRRRARTHVQRSTS